MENKIGSYYMSRRIYYQNIQSDKDTQKEKMIGILDGDAKQAINETLQPRFLDHKSKPLTKEEFLKEKEKDL